ncbi:integral membrane protein [Magnaporthiopsis poae ATCC 64411]|uniref:Integral membrane protein n=1 Tax=Magnaporthiopsis poae (strain ATCC 64411 / 73-15) TaxID=644358 RepID=A0A0C4DWK3_MAGP6|nr:integral membrane protein [Magnaporthiopsis poae ATCC 64411]
MILTDLFSMILRLAELAFAAIVAGLTGEHLHRTQNVSAWDNGRHIYTIVVAAISMLLAIVWLFPFSGSFIHWPTDFIISVMWFAAFGLLVDWLNGACGDVFDWSGIRLRGNDICAKQKAIVAFAFLSAICWLASALLGILWVRRRERAVATAGHRRRWYRSRARV